MEAGAAMDLPYRGRVIGGKWSKSQVFGEWSSQGQTGCSHFTGLFGPGRSSLGELEKEATCKSDVLLTSNMMQAPKPYSLSLVQL